MKFLEIAQRERVTHAMLVPVQYQRILAHPDFDKYDLGSFKAKLSTSAPLRAHIKADCLARWPGRLIEIYGLTEGGGSCMLEANLHPDKLHTVGKPGLGSEIVVLDEQGRVLPQGEVGELAGRAQVMMKGYYKQDDKTRELFWHDSRRPAVLQVGRHGQDRRGRLRRPARSQEGHDHLRRLQRLCRRHRGAAAEASRRRSTWR